MAKIGSAIFVVDFTATANRFSVTCMVLPLIGAVNVPLVLEGGEFFLGDQDLGTYVSANDTWWRLRGSASALWFDTSPTGEDGDWTPRGQVPVPFSLDAIHVRFDLALAAADQRLQRLHPAGLPRHGHPDQRLPGPGVIPDPP